MKMLNRYRVLQLLFILLFLTSVMAIWFLGSFRGENIPGPDIDEAFQTRVPQAITPFPVTPTEGSIGESTATPTPGGISPEGAGSFTLYTIQPGDTLASIADEFNVTVPVLIQANGLTSNNLSANQQILIPNNSAFSIVNVAATVEAVVATQGALGGRATAVAATAQANSAEISQLATRQFEYIATVEANSIKIDVLAGINQTTEVRESGWLSLLTGPILASILAVGGFLTSTWFEWREDRREANTLNAEVEKQRLELELKLLAYQVQEKEQELKRRRQNE